MTHMPEDIRNPNPEPGETDVNNFVPDYLLYLLAAASEAASDQFHDQVRAAGLRVPEWRVLACLHDRDGSMITHLARFALVEQSRLTRIIGQMDARGLVHRRGDPEDRRRVRVYLTEQGRALAGRLVGQARDHEARLLHILKNGDAGRLKPALRALLESMKKDADPAP